MTCPSSSLLIRYLCRQNSLSSFRKHLSVVGSSREISLNPCTAGQIHLINSVDEWCRLWPTLEKSLECFPAVGFDCEWPTSPTPDWDKLLSEQHQNVRRLLRHLRRGPVSLIQLGFRDGPIVLVRLNKLDKVPESLKSLLANDRYLKVGVEPTLDAKRLAKDDGQTFGCIRGTFDVRYLLPSDEMFMTATSGQFVSYSLAQLCRTYLQVNCQKDIRLTLSDWAAPELTTEQIEYASTDAHLSISIFISMLQKLHPHAENEWHTTYELCRPFLDMTVKKAKVLL